MFNKVVGRNLALAAGFFWTGAAGYGQGVDATETPGPALVEIPTAQTATPSNSGEDLTMAGEYKSAKNVVEQEKPVFWTWYTDAGYESEYNFRGTNLTPNSDGAVFGDARVTKWGFTLGLFAIHQLGDAHVDSWSAGEGGGSAAGAIAGATSNVGIVPYTRFPITTQTRFDELDAFLSYKFSLGFIDVTLGNIGFFIERRAQTFEKDVLPPNFIWNIPDTDTRFRFLGPNPTVQNEHFDRAYITLSTTKLSKYVTPQITYYQTLLSAGAEPEAENIKKYPLVFVDGPIGLTPFFHREPTGFVNPTNPRPNDLRNEALGGYLEGRLNGHFPITNWLDFDPFTLVSVSFRDRAEPGGTHFETAPPLPSGSPNPRAGSGVYGAHPLTGWNHFQAGIELPIHLVHLGGFSSERWAPPDAHLYFVPFGDYSYHISNPTPGTDRDEWWGGGKFELTF
jgi:hypothetical protein